MPNAGVGYTLHSQSTAPTFVELQPRGARCNVLFSWELENRMMLLSLLLLGTMEFLEVGNFEMMHVLSSINHEKDWRILAALCIRIRSY
jgi:hypothetical protein